MNKLYAWLGVIALLAQIPLTFMIYAKDAYVGACYLAILILYLLEVCTNVKLRTERKSIYWEGMLDKTKLSNDVSKRIACGDDPIQVVKEEIEKYKNKFE